MTHTRTRVIVIAVALLAVVSTSFEAGEPDSDLAFRVRALPSLGGTNSRGNGINNWGLISGFSNLEGDAARRATLWFGGRAFDLDTLGGTNSNVGWSRQNDTGLVVGIAQTSALQTRKDGWSCRAFFPGPDATKYICVGFAWEWGRMRPLPTLGGDNGFATSANNRRQVVGWAETRMADSTCTNPADRGFNAVVWDLNRGQTFALPPYGTDTASAATAISDRGHVVGISGDCDQSVGRRSARHAVLWERGSVKDLGNLGADSWNTPTAITSRGDIIVGFANAPDASPEAPRFRAWLWTERDDISCPKLAGTNLCDLGTLEPGGTAEARGVNHRGQVVGTACPPTGNCRAFLWEHGEMKDLNQFKRQLSGPPRERDGHQRARPGGRSRANGVGIRRYRGHAAASPLTWRLPRVSPITPRFSLPD